MSGWDSLSPTHQGDAGLAGSKGDKVSAAKVWGRAGLGALTP